MRFLPLTRQIELELSNPEGIIKARPGTIFYRAGNTLFFLIRGGVQTRITPLKRSFGLKYQNEIWYPSILDTSIIFAEQYEVWKKTGTGDNAIGWEFISFKPYNSSVLPPTPTPSYVPEPTPTPTPTIPPTPTPTIPLNAAFWVDANDLVLSNGADVAAWSDKSGTNHQLTSSLGTAPTFATNHVNGNDAVRFQALGAMVATGSVLSGSSQNTTFIVYVPDASSLGILFEQEASLYSMEHTVGLQPRFYIGNTGGALSTSSLVGQPTLTIALASGGFMRNETSGVTGSWTAFSSTTGNTVFTLGGRFSNPHYYTDTYICEMLVYNRALSEVDISTVRTYLTTKYGL
jgi:hypothetical protein